MHAHTHARLPSEQRSDRLSRPLAAVRPPRADHGTRGARRPLVLQPGPRGRTAAAGPPGRCGKDRRGLFQLGGGCMIRGRRLECSLFLLSLSLSLCLSLSLYWYCDFLVLVTPRAIIPALPLQGSSLPASNHSERDRGCVKMTSCPTRFGSTCSSSCFHSHALVAGPDCIQTRL